MSLFGKIVRAPWWLVSKGVIGAVGVIAGGVGLVKGGHVLEGVTVIAGGINMIGQRHSNEKVARAIEASKKK